MPRFQPAASPRFSSSTTRTPGNRARTNATVPSDEPLSTTTVSSATTLSRQRSIQASASYVTTTQAARPRSAMLEPCARPSADPFPEQDHPAGHRESGRDEEEQEAGGESLVGRDADAPEEAHEEGLPHRDPVERERDEEHEEEQRPHHVVDPRAEVDAHGLSGRPDGEHAHCLDRGGEEKDADEEPEVPAEVVDAVVERPHRPLDADPPQQRLRSGEQRARRPCEEEEHQDERAENEESFEPEVRADVVLPDGKDEPDRAEKHRAGAAQAPLEEDDPR